jgi:hypothetical protein
MHFQSNLSATCFGSSPSHLQADLLKKKSDMYNRQCWTSIVNCTYQWWAETCCWEIWLKIHFNNYLIVVVLYFIFIYYRATCVDQVQRYKYLGSIINDGISIEEEVKERITLGIKAYCANQKIFNNRLVTKSSKLKLYRTLIRPIVTYPSETWVLK